MISDIYYVKYDMHGKADRGIIIMDCVTIVYHAV